MAPRLVIKKLLSLCFLVLLTITPASRALAETPPVTTAAQASIDPRVLADTANGQSANFLVVLKNQADLASIQSRFAGINSPSNSNHSAMWVAQGQAVVDGLRQSAAKSQPAVTDFFQSAGVTYHPFWIVNAIALKGDRAMVDALAARPDVTTIESDRAFKVPLEPLENGINTPQSPQGIEPNLSQVQAPDLWRMGYTGQGEVYASADTGVQWDHPALKTHYRGWDAATSIVDHNYNWWDAIRDDSISPGSEVCPKPSLEPCDDYGHGTHTTGIGVGDDGQGNQIGVAPGAKWIACRNMDNGTGRPSTYMACLQFFIAPTDLSGNNPNPSKRADVINNSYDCPPSELCAPTSLHDAIEAVRAAGIFMAVSAGNSGPSCSSITNPPGLEADVFTVGAVDSSNVITTYSDRGPVTYNSSTYRKPNLVAPGGTNLISIRSSEKGGGYGGKYGTSMAAPHVAGAVLLIWSAAPNLRHNVSQTEALLKQNAVRRTSDEGCGGDSSTAVPNNVYGYGVLSVLQAYVATLPFKTYVSFVGN